MNKTKTNFKLEKHSIKADEEVVEIWAEGNLIATIYQVLGEGKSKIRIVSKYGISTWFLEAYSDMEVIFG